MRIPVGVGAIIGVILIAIRDDIIAVGQIVGFARQLSIRAAHAICWIIGAGLEIRL